MAAAAASLRNLLEQLLGWQVELTVIELEFAFEAKYAQQLCYFSDTHIEFCLRLCIGIVRDCEL